MVKSCCLVRIDRLRPSRTPLPQAEFNQTENRKGAEQGRGIVCLDCPANLRADAAFRNAALKVHASQVLPIVLDHFAHAQRPAAGTDARSAMR